MYQFGFYAQPALNSGTPPTFCLIISSSLPRRRSSATSATSTLGCSAQASSRIPCSRPSCFFLTLAMVASFLPLSVSSTSCLIAIPSLGAPSFQSSLSLVLLSFAFIHGLSVKLGLDRNVFVGSAQLMCYNSLSQISDARKLFDEMTDRDTVLWTSMLSGYAQSEKPELAFTLFNKMVHQGIVLDVVVMVNALGRADWVVEVERFINEMPFEPDGATLQALLSFFRVHGDMETAKRIANKLVIACPESSGCYMSMANIYSDVGQYDESKRVREYMKGINVVKVPGWSTSWAILSWYAKKYRTES
ncbi:hypothetical protein LUZ61_019666 [Rhynchospora tenuis]|uniref:Pentatricopeptide repeat-containing protein n=1 Tax=Rhynchospora tenuis TaxID=198213 RepID=A0AAD5ZBL0_9POAL|nr:hypothetical protein LUZ61_019666 [Rhynchospora tenuis]